MLTKICGLTDKRETEYLNKNQVDFAGMVLFFEKSKRNITIEKAKEIMSGLDSRIKKVAVVVSPTVDQAKSICQAGFDIIQIHGTLTTEVYDVINIQIWKAFNIKDMDQYAGFRNRDKIKGFVFDSAQPGSGLAYDRSLLTSIQRDDTELFILAGGLNAKNVADAMAEVHPDVVDVSSAVEYKDRPGKNPELIDEFINAVKKAEPVC